MTTKLLIPIVVASLIFTACGDKTETTTTEVKKVAEPTKTDIAVEKSKDALSAIETAVSSKVDEAKEIIAKKTPEIKEAVVAKTEDVTKVLEEKVANVTKMVNDSMKSGETLYKPCAGCHGAKAEKKALGKSAVVKGWSEDKIYQALVGYKDGSYGGAMKGLMKGQVSKLTDGNLKSLASYISKF
ncbi:MAG: c-type cytochrome [Campylobacterota bacterium]|nr:c-type cytochrome [Campylobacterota bacterium]